MVNLPHGQEIQGSLGVGCLSEVYTAARAVEWLIRGRRRSRCDVSSASLDLVKKQECRSAAISRLQLIERYERDIQNRSLH